MSSKTPDRKIYFIIFAYAGLFLLGLSDNMRGPLYTEVRSTYQLTHQSAALFFTMSSLFSIVGSFLAPAIMKLLFRHSGQAAVSHVHTLILAIGLMATGLFIQTFSPQFGWLLSGVMVTGFSLGLMGVAQNTIVLENTVASQTNRIQAGLHSMYGLSSLLAPLYVAMVLSLFSQNSAKVSWFFNLLSGKNQPIWKMSFFSLAVVSVFVVAVILRLMSKNRWGQVLPLVEAEKSESPIHLVASPVEVRRKSEKFIYRSVLLAAFLSLYVVVEVVLSTRLSQFLIENRSFTLTEGSVQTSLFFVFMLLGRVGLAFGSVPLLKIFKSRLFVLLSTSLILTLMCLVLGLYVHHVFFALSGLTMSVVYPLTMGWAKEHFPQDLSRVVSWCLALSSVLLMISQWMMGWLCDHHGSFVGLHLLIVFGVLSLGSLYLFESSHPSQKAQSS